MGSCSVFVVHAFFENQPCFLAKTQFFLDVSWFHPELLLTLNINHFPK